jgi:nitrate/TMAO reductase-like tetraheme cytochrome c subunit
MKKAILLLVGLAIIAVPAMLYAENTIPAGKENLVLDKMSKAKEAAGKKALKGPVPLDHKGHVDRGTKCIDCHHGQKPEEAIKPCGDCHKDKDEGKTPKMDDAFHGGDGALLALSSCIGCHKRVVYEKDKLTKAPFEKKPCEACHSLKKK